MKRSVDMGELITKQDVTKALTAVEIPPLEVDTELNSLKYTSKLPLSRIQALGAGWQPVVSAIQQLTSGGEAVSGLYRVTIPKGTRLAKFKDGSGYLGTALDTSGINSQARLNAVLCDPTMLFVATTLANIDKKLDSIQETQKEMRDFLVQKEKSELKGDLDFLIDVYNNYKYNWDNDKFKAANHIKTLDIRQNAGRKIDFYREQIKTKVEKQTLIHADKDVKKQLEYVEEQFKEYQTALYLYGFGYFLEVLLQENYDEKYLESIQNKIDTFAFQYRELYSNVYSQIEKYSKTSLQSRFFGGLSTVNRVAGEAIAKIPVISKSQIDETLINNGAKLGEYSEKRVKASMQQLIERQSSCVRPFIESISAIIQMYNKQVSILFNKESIYIGCSD